MNNIDAILLLILALLSLLHLHRRVERLAEHQPIDGAQAQRDGRKLRFDAGRSQTDTESDDGENAKTAICDGSDAGARRLGFDARCAWHAQAPLPWQPQRFLYRQWRAAERMLGNTPPYNRSSAARVADEAWVVLLDGDDGERHYMHAALAHANAIAQFDRRRDRLLLLNTAFDWKDRCD